MLKFKIARKNIIIPLQRVAGVVERRQSIAVLSNILIQVTKRKITLKATDSDIELKTTIVLDDTQDVTAGEITVPARKLLDICKSLSENVELEFRQEKNQIHINVEGESLYVLSTLPATEFPDVDSFEEKLRIKIKQSCLRQAINKTSFAMAHQDIRHYLNGILFEVENLKLRLVATDGHRLALCDIEDIQCETQEKYQILIPRKSILELARLLATEEEDYLEISLGDKCIKAVSRHFTFTSKLTDGVFPEYKTVIPRDKRGFQRYILKANREHLKSSLQRAAILSSEKYRGVRVLLSSDQLKLVANNPEQEQAEEFLKIEYQGCDLSIGFNVSYLLDVLTVLSGESVNIKVSDSNSSITIEDELNSNPLYVVMPMIF